MPRYTSDSREKIRDDLEMWRESAVTTMVVSGATEQLRTIAELVQDYLGGRVSAPVGEGQVARRTLEDFRANHAHNSTFHTPAGDL